MTSTRPAKRMNVSQRMSTLCNELALGAVGASATLAAAAAKEDTLPRFLERVSSSNSPKGTAQSMVLSALACFPAIRLATIRLAANGAPRRRSAAATRVRGAHENVVLLDPRASEKASRLARGSAARRLQDALSRRPICDAGATHASTRDPTPRCARRCGAAADDHRRIGYLPSIASSSRPVQVSAKRYEHDRRADHNSTLGSGPDPGRHGGFGAHCSTS